MFALTNKPDMAARLYSRLILIARCRKRGVDAMQILQHMAGILVEIALVFDEPEEALVSTFNRLELSLGTSMNAHPMGPQTLPPPHLVDDHTETGRSAAREFFEEWLDCAFEFHDLVTGVFSMIIVQWEEEGLQRSESLRILWECTRTCMIYEIAAQELCDVVIDTKIGVDKWSIADCVAALSAISGHHLAASLNASSCSVFRGADIPDHLDTVARVMTREAVRLGVPAGTDWRFGLPANDTPLNPPYDLVQAIYPYCRSFFDAAGLLDPYEQAIACAKAAGRMIAVAAGGELPQMEPAIAKPLAMAALTETYKAVCMDYQLASRQ